jgi:hypothetical protein
MQCTLHQSLSHLLDCLIKSASVALASDDAAISLRTNLLHHEWQKHVQVLPALFNVVDKSERDIGKGKHLYMKLGCRGDWPEVQAPDWQPDDAIAVQEEAPAGAASGSS